MRHKPVYMPILCKAAQCSGQCRAGCGRFVLAYCIQYFTRDKRLVRSGYGGKGARLQKAHMVLHCFPRLTVFPAVSLLTAHHQRRGNFWTPKKGAARRAWWIFRGIRSARFRVVALIYYAIRARHGALPRHQHRFICGHYARAITQIGALRSS